MSKKRKHQRRLSASSEEDDEISFGQDFTRAHKSVRNKSVVKSQVNFERSAEEREKSSSSARKDDSKSPHQVRKHLRTLTKTNPTKQKPVSDEISLTESRSGHAHVFSSKTENYISKKGITIKGSKTKERTPSNLIYTKRRDTVPPSVKTSKARSKKETSRLSPSTSQKQQSTSSLVSTKQEEGRLHPKKKKCNAVVPLWTGNYYSTVGAKWSSSTSSKDVAQKNREELLKKNGKIHQTKVFEDKKSSWTDAKHNPCSSTKKSSIAANHTVSNNTLKRSMTGTPVSDIKSDLQKTSEPTSCRKQIHSLIPSSPICFKIQKKILKKTVEPKDEKNNGIPKNTNLKNQIRLPRNEGAFDSNQETADPVQSCLGVAPHCSLEGPSASSSLQFTADDNTCSDQVNVVEQLYLARSQRRLEVNVMESYGELTCMDIDLPEEGSADTQYKQQQLDLILVLDTNILLSHLDYVKRISSEGLNALGFPHILIPWVVLQELDSLKKGRGLAGSVAHLAIPAISYIYNSLRSRKPNIWGQSMQQAAERRNGLNAENNDDRVLQCCLQYQILYPESALILCTNDKNLCSKALLSGVKALGIHDLKTEAERSQLGIHLQQDIEVLVSPPFINSQVSSPALRSSCSQVQQDAWERGGVSIQFKERETTQLSKANEDGGKCNLSQSISEFEECLREVMADVLEVEMKAIYEDLWTEIVFLKPPWTLHDVLKCFRKHWVAVFRYILPKSSEETIVNLINFFDSGNNKDRIATSKILEEARKLVKLFQDRSSHVPRVLSIMDKIFTKLHPQESHQIVEEESSTLDVVMIDDGGSGGHDDDEAEKGKQSSTCHVSHQEVWTMFESIWNVVVQTSMDVFKALNFDTQTMQSAQSVRDSPPPQDALVCLHKLSTMVSQLLQGFSSVLASTNDIEAVQALLSVIQSYKIAGLNSNVTAKDLLDCFLQPEYREKLQLGGRQLLDLQDALSCCAQAHSFSTCH